MPTEYIGASFEPKEMPYWALFNARDELQREINDRAWMYIRVMGYEPYKQTSMHVVFTKIGKVENVTIICEFEQNFKSETIILNVPYKQFEVIVPHKVAK